MIWAFVDTPKTLLNGNDDGDTAATEVVPGEGRQISQKRITRSLERSVGWLEKLMSGLRLDQKQQQQTEQSDEPKRPPIIVPLMGGCDRRARAEFAQNLTEKMDHNDQKKTGLYRLDDGIFGYAIEMVDLPTNQYHSPPSPALDSEGGHESSDSEDPDSTSQAAEGIAHPRNVTNKLTGLVRSSLKPLSRHKPRIAHTAPSPHAVLRLVLECGIDLFDIVWAQQASDYGIALNFEFPVPTSHISQDEKGKGKDIGSAYDSASMKQQIGVNLFEDRYAEDISPLGSLETSWPCAPTPGPPPILHSVLDDQQWSPTTEPTSTSQPFTRAYIHHLLRTHEMSSHVLLQLHNLAVADQFFKNIRGILHSAGNVGNGEEKLRAEIIRFYETYEIPTRLYQEAKSQWKEVDTSRGKGRLKREREAAAALSETDPATVEGEQTAATGAGIVTQATVAEALEDVS
jgi:queuine tRNA-ribosyltransferase